MTTDKVIEIAKRCGATYYADTILVNGKDAHDIIVSFAAEIERQTAEACAKVSSNHPAEPWRHDSGAAHVCDMVSTSIAAAIRAGKYKEFMEWQ